MQVQALIIQYNIFTDRANIFVCSLINISWYADRPVQFHCLSIHVTLVDKRWILDNLQASRPGKIHQKWNANPKIIGGLWEDLRKISTPFASRIQCYKEPFGVRTSAYEVKNKDWQDSGDVSQDNFNTLMPGQSARNVAEMLEIIAWHQTRDAPLS